MSNSGRLDHFLVESVSKVFTTDFAENLVNVRAGNDPAVKARIGELRQKADDGKLTPDEDVEYKEYVEAVDVLSALQIRARRFLGA